MQATRNLQYLKNGEVFMDDLYRHSWTIGGWASIGSVVGYQKEDHMHSFFLAETCKYLFLLYNDTFLRVRAVQTRCWSRLPAQSTPAFYDFGTAFPGC